MKNTLKYSAYHQHEKINKTSEDMKEILIESLYTGKYNFITTYAKSIGVYREAIIKNITRWDFERRKRSEPMSEYDIIINGSNADLSFSERYNNVMNYVNSKNKESVTFSTHDTLQEL